MPSPRTALVGVCLIAAAFTGSPRAQAPRPAPITFDLSASSRDGSPVTNLQPADISIRVNGRVQTISALTLARPSDAPAPLLPAPYATNQGAPGRTIAIAVDIARIQEDRITALNQGLKRLVTALHPHDRASLLALTAGGFALDFTTRHARILSAAATLKGRTPATQTPREIEASALASLGMLERVLTSLSTDPEPKTMVFATAGFPSTGDIRKAIDGVARAVASQRVQLRVIDMGSASASSPAGLTALVAATGATLGSSANEGSFVTAGEAPSAAYTVTLTPPDELETGKIHRVQIASIRPDVLVTGPVAYATPHAATGIVALADLVRQPRIHRDLPLRLAVFPVQDTDRDKLRLLILGESEDPARQLAWAEFALVAPNGAVLSQWKVEGAEVAARPLFTAALATEGAYRLRMAASELSGRRGTVDVEFDARLTPAGAFALGPVMFGAMSADAFAPQLQPSPAATAVMAYAEIYGRPDATDTLTAAFEVARTTDGAPVSTTAGSVRTTPDPLRRAALATLDLTALAPGDYVVRAIISRNGTEIGRVSRTLRTGGKGPESRVQGPES